MTGGQIAEGTPTVPSIAGQLKAEGVGRTVVLSEKPEQYATVALPTVSR